MPKVFIIILNWNNWADTLECLKSLRDNDYPNYQVVIVDNGSKEKPQPPAPEIKVIYNKKNLGFSGGNNVGIRYAMDNGADYILLLNDDTVVSNNFLTKLVEVAESEKRIGMVGPKIYFYNQQKNVIPSQRERCEESCVESDKSFVGIQGGEASEQKIWFAGGKINWLYNRGEMRGYSEIDKGQYDFSLFQETDYLTACCVLIKRKVVEEIGLLPEEYFLYYEDTDWSLAARKAGFECIFSPVAKIWHKGSKSSLEGSPSYIYYHIRNGLILAQKYAPWYILPFVHLDAFWRMIKQPIKLLIPSKRKWVKPILLGIKDFYLGRRGKLKQDL